MAHFNRLLTFTLLLHFTTFLGAAEVSDTLSTLPRTAPGTELGTIKVGTRTFNEVRIKSYDSRSVIFTHSGGLGSARLRDLSPDLQGLLGYDSSQSDTKTASKSVVVKPSPAPALTPLPRPIETTETTDTTTPSTFDALVTSFGTKPDIRATQSLQNEFLRLSFTAKSQGRRLSCAIFAVVGALEFQNAKATGTPQKLSEEYLIWATRRIIGHAPADPKPPANTSPPPKGTAHPDVSTDDLGYSLSEVVSGLRAYGIAAQYEMPNRNTEAEALSFTPDETLIASARTRRLVNILPVPGRQNQTVLSNIVQALNRGYPVPIGLRWPEERSIRAGYLRDQTPRPKAFHAVTLVGYVCPSARIEDTVFIFRNSFGVGWGIDGYGRSTWGYLEQNLTDAIVLDLGPGVKPKPDTKL